VPPRGKADARGCQDMAPTYGLQIPNTRAPAMSALKRISDPGLTLRDDRKVPKEAASSFDHFVSAGKEKRWNTEPEFSRGLKVEPQIKHYRLLDRNIARLFSFYYLVHHRC
jgi:hypothetical protein